MPTKRRLEGVVILVVEDDVDSRVVLSQLLELQGATVLAADCGFTALRLLRNHSPNVLLSDITMPGMDGIELIEEIRARERLKKATENVDAHLPAAAISALDTPEDRKKCIQAGFHAHISKPVDFAVLVGVLAGLVGNAQAARGSLR